MQLRILYTKVIVLLLLISSSVAFCQTASIKWNGANYTVILKDAEGRSVDTSKFGPVKPFVKDGYLYTVMINPNSDFHTGYSYWITLYNLKELKFKASKEYSFSIGSDKVKGCRASQKLLNSFDVSLNKKKLMVCYGYDKNKTKIKIVLNEVSLNSMGSKICESVKSQYNPSENCFICNQ